jgi:MtfA peptidase
MVFTWLRNRRHRRALALPFPDEWRGWLERNFAHWRCLNDDERRRMEDLVRMFIADKYWEGGGGFEVTDEMKVTIAAQACLLLLNIEHDFYRIVRTIIVYPSGYFAPSRSGIGGGAVIETPGLAVLGQAHYRGPVILSWQHVRHGGVNPHDGHNLVFHEFAHKLDMADGMVDGTPPLRDREQLREWVEVMTREFVSLRNGHGSLLRSYGATNPGEFFAVATEAFFEQPLEMRHMHPDLYGVLQRFYRQDPAQRMADAAADARG